MMKIQKLRVIEGIQKVKPNYRKLYSNAYINAVQCAIKEMKEVDNFHFRDVSLDIRKKIILFGVKNINATDLDMLDYDLLVGTFNSISMLNTIMGTLTPREFLTIFPIAKEYDGEKYQMKDYYYAQKFIEEFGMDKLIGEEAMQFHMEYYNREITSFVVQTMCVMSAIRRAEGGKGIAEEFFEKEGLPTYTMTEDIKGKQLLTNNQTGETQQVKKKRPRYLKVIK